MKKLVQMPGEELLRRCFFKYFEHLQVNTMYILSISSLEILEKTGISVLRESVKQAEKCLEILEKTGISVYTLSTFQLTFSLETLEKTGISVLRYRINYESLCLEILEKTGISVRQGNKVCHDTA